MKKNQKIKIKVAKDNKLGFVVISVIAENRDLVTCIPVDEFTYTSLSNELTDLVNDQIQNMPSFFKTIKSLLGIKNRQ